MGHKTQNDHFIISYSKFLELKCMDKKPRKMKGRKSATSFTAHQ